MSEELKAIEELFDRGESQAALDRLGPFLEKEPDNLRALNDLGAILQSLNDGAGAVAAFSRAVDYDPGHRNSRTNLALALAAAERWAEAKEQLQILLAENQNEAKLWTWLAKIEQALGDLGAAVEYLDRSLLIEPDQPRLREARAKMAQTRNAQPGPRPSVLLCCQKSLENFALELCDELEKQSAVVKRMVVDSFPPLEWPIKSADTVWLEWGTTMAVAATQAPGLLQGKKVILRLHSFEILSREAARINYQAVTDVIFVSRYMRDIFQRLMPGLLTGRHRVHIIHNGIDLHRFPFASGRGRRKIAFIGRLNFKKDPMLLVQAFAFLLRRHPELELHVAGAPDDNRYYLSLPDFLAKNKLASAATFYGHLQDIPGWLADKDFILSTSPFESQGVGILEAVHRGLRPLVYNFPGAEELYPADWLWNNLDELEERLLAGPEPAECRAFVAEKYSMARQAAHFLQVITGSEPVVEPPPVPPQTVQP
ncbi:MAG: glycosyltransferase [Candidatus Adiutrix sp.]|jgi:glycosyltransferase involved in cell wall biosynthesis|nr:glycosyltransferase [Candidatus Adiutrix sp.]